MNDADFMRHALSLAQNVSRASPNPRVGCVIVKKDRIVGKGFHEKAGGPHAEAVALSEAGKDAKGATAYVTLEPCVHTDKKTPPCAQAFVKAGLSRVVVAVRDQNPKVNGRGIALLKQNGVSVAQGVLAEQGLEVNRFFFKFASKQVPWVTLKMASTLDGKITSNAGFVSNASARKIVQRLRAEHDAVLVGKNTVLSDNPRLNCRLPNALQPLKVVVDSELECPPTARVFSGGNAVVACTKKALGGRVQAFREKGVAVWVLPASRIGVDLEALLDKMGQAGVLSVLLEGGGKMASSFLEQKLVDEAYFFVAPKFAGSQAVPMYDGSPLAFGGAHVAVVDDNACFRVKGLSAVKPGHDE